MTDDPGPDDVRPQTIARMQAIAAGLEGAGLSARVHEISGVMDVTASLHRPGSKAIDLTVDEDHYIHVSWWNPDDAAPAQVIEVISRVLAAITG